VLPSVPAIVTCVALVAVTVNVDEPPVTIEVGLAAMLTVGAGATVTVVPAVAFPPAPVAVAVYVVVTVGLTAWVPPAACRVYVLPSVPVTVTAVAFVAATVNVDELPEAIEVGLAEMLTVGATGGPDGVTVTVAVAVVFPPAPVAVAV
jgi:hypothetical protein